MSERTNPLVTNTKQANEAASSSSAESAFDHLTLENRLESAGILLDEHAPAPGLAISDASSGSSHQSSSMQMRSQDKRERLAQWQEEFTQNLPARSPMAAVAPTEPNTNELGSSFAPPVRAGKNLLWLVVGLATALGIWATQLRLDPATPDPLAAQPIDDAPVTELYEPVLSAPPFAPECWRRDEGFRFRYKDASDKIQTVDRVTQVPTLYRRNAECVAVGTQTSTSTP